jgi:hypothetical protein
MSINTSVHHVTSIKLGTIGELSEKGSKYRGLEIETKEGFFRMTLFADDIAQLLVHLEKTSEV